MSKLIKMVYQQILENEDPDTFATFQYRDGSEAFVQLKFNAFNAFYPSLVAPDIFLAEKGIVFPEDSELISWQGNNHITIEFPEIEPSELATFVELYCSKVFGKAISKETVTTEVEW